MRADSWRRLRPAIKKMSRDFTGPIPHDSSEKKMNRLTLAALLAAVAAPALAQEPVSTPFGQPPADERFVEIAGRPADLSLHDYVAAFVDEVGDPVNDTVGYARWINPICVSVHDLPEDAGQYLVDRVSAVADELGVRLRGPGCRPNITILFSTDGAALASYLVEDQPRVFRPYGGAGETTQGLTALAEFSTSDAAVRWWQVSLPVDRAGQVGVQTSNLAGMAGAEQPIPSMRTANSRISNTVRDALMSAIIIIDATKLDAANWEQLADYVAMVSLAQIDPAAAPSDYDTILSLFSVASPPAGLTDWDMAYLRALYEMDQLKIQDTQRAEIVTLMTRDRAEAGE